MRKKIISFLLLSFLSLVVKAQNLDININVVECNSKDSIVFKSCDSLSKQECYLISKMQEFATYLQSKQKPCSTIVSEVNKRYKTFTDTATYKIKYKPLQWLGDSNAPVSVIMYISMSCPRCKEVYAALYDSLVTNPRLKKIMRLGILCFTTTRIDKAVMASAELWKQPKFLRALANIKERITEEMVEHIADSMGIDHKRLWKIADSEKMNKFINSSREEAINNQVELTPTLFINRTFYRSSKDAHWILDFVRYKAEKKKKNLSQ